MSGAMKNLSSPVKKNQHPTNPTNGGQQLATPHRSDWSSSMMRWTDKSWCSQVLWLSSPSCFPKTVKKSGFVLPICQWWTSGPPSRRDEKLSEEQTRWCKRKSGFDQQRGRSFMRYPKKAWVGAPEISQLVKTDGIRPGTGTCHIISLWLAKFTEFPVHGVMDYDNPHILDSVIKCTLW